MRFIDLTGKKFGRLTVLGTSKNKGIQVMYTCKCDCGNICEARGDKLRSGKTKSCGCLQKEYLKNENGDRSKKYEIGGALYTKNEILKLTHMSPATFYRKIKDTSKMERILKNTGGV